MPVTTFKTIPEFNYFIDKGLSQGNEPPAIVFPLFLHCAPEELGDIASNRKASAHVRMVSEDIFALSIGLRKRDAHGYLLNYHKYWIAFVTSNPDRRHGNAVEIAARWVHNMFPLVVPCRITSQQLVDLVDSLKVVERSQINVLDYVTRSATEKETNKHWPKGLIFSKAIIRERAIKDEAIVDAIKIEFISPNYGFTIKLSRRGHAIFYGGRYSEFQRLVIEKLVSLAQLNLEKAGKRERVLKEGEVQLDPLVIHPERDLTSKELFSVKESLERRYMTAVFYGGNPMLMMSLIDKSDGSTVDLHAYHNEIIITPVVRVTAASLMKLLATLEEALPTNQLYLD